MNLLAPYAAAAGALGLVIATLIYVSLRRQPAGTPAMQELAGLIETGAMAFLRREYMVLVPFLLVVAALLAWAVGGATAIAYILGGACSIVAGLFGMKAATKANVRTAEAARSSGQACRSRRRCATRSSSVRRCRTRSTSRSGPAARSRSHCARR